MTCGIAVRCEKLALLGGLLSQVHKAYMLRRSWADSVSGKTPVMASDYTPQDGSYWLALEASPSEAGGSFPQSSKEKSVTPPTTVCANI